jgi:hypothetical protein
MYSVVGIGTCHGLDGPGIEYRRGEILSTVKNRPWVPPSLLYNGYQVIPGVKRLGRGFYHPSTSSAEVKEGVELYLYSKSGS